MGLNLIAIFESSPERAQTYLDRLHAPFPVIVDPARELYGAYGLEASPFSLLRAMMVRSSVLRAARSLHLSAGANLMEMSGKADGAFSRLPGDFLIGPDGRIQLAHYGRGAGDFLLFRELETAAFGAPLPE
jgi:thioredoxin-dependent peroxiredoxin